MNTSKKVSLASVLLFVIAVQANGAIVWKFLPKSGSSFDFANTPNNSFKVDGPFELVSNTGTYSDGTPVTGEVGFEGEITGTFAIDNINPAPVVPNWQIGQVSGSGTFTVADGQGGAVTGDLTFDTIETITVSAVTNLSAPFLNLTNITTTSNHSDFKALASDGFATATFTFALSSGQTLETLLADDHSQETYDLNVESALPELTSIAAWSLLGLIGLVFARKR
jgi:hypothetical protein